MSGLPTGSGPGPDPNPAAAPGAGSDGAGAPDGQTTAERRSIEEARRVRRRGHGDLPAKYRRRQAIALGVIVLIFIFLLSRLFGGCGGSDKKDEPLALKRLVGQTLVGRVGKSGPNAQLLKAVRKGRIGSVIVTAGKENTTPDAIKKLQAAADKGGNPPLLVMVDQEGGNVKRFPGPPMVSPSDLGEGGDADASKSAGSDTGKYLKGLGINVDLAPVLDTRRANTAQTIASRTFSDDPEVVSSVGVAFGEGLQSEGVAATAKHFPGLGLATVNTDDRPVTIAAPASALDEALTPFKAAIDSDLDLVMVGTATYPGYAGKRDKGPAALSRPVVTGLLRSKLGYDGVVITDDLESGAVLGDNNQSASGVAALLAGNDLLLYARTAAGPTKAMQGIVKAVNKGTLDRERIQESYDRIVTLKTQLAGG